MPCTLRWPEDQTGDDGELLITDDNTADYQNFSDFTAQKGVPMYNEDGTYGGRFVIPELHGQLLAQAAGATGASIACCSRCRSCPTQGPAALTSARAFTCSRVTSTKLGFADMTQ